MLHTARGAVGRPIVAQRRSLSCDARFERAADAAVELADLARVKRAGGTPGIDLRPPEGLVRVDVPDTCEGSLVEESCLHRSTPPGQAFAQVAGREFAFERFKAEAGREIRVGLVCSKHEPGSEPPDVAVGDVRAVV